MTSSSAIPVGSHMRRVGPFEVGPIGFGCWRLTTTSTEEAASLVEGALDLGCTLVDTADVYGLDWGGDGFGTCEARLGQVLLQRPSLRDRMVLATKGGIVPGVPYDSSPGGITQACESSLRRLHVDHVDLYQIHRPDLFAHPGELAEALVNLHDRGLVREFGVSNHTPAQTVALQAFLPMPLVSTQPEFSAAHLAPMRDGTFDHALATGLAVLAWSPLAGGRLATGDDCPPALIAELDRIAGAHDTDRATVALAFVLAHPCRPVAIVGTQRLERIESAVQAADLSFGRADLYGIVQACEGQALP